MSPRLPDENDSTADGVPLVILNKLRRYGLYHEPVGDFLRAVLCNDLLGATGRADITNAARLCEIVRFCYNALPSQSWKSREAVDAWLKQRKEPNEPD